MRLTNQETTRLFGEGLLISLLFLLTLIGTISGGNYIVSLVNKNEKNIKEVSKNLLEANRHDSKEIKFLRENQQGIDLMWSSLKPQGGLSSSSLEPVIQAGLSGVMPIPASKLPGNPTEYQGMKLSGNKTEYQRLLDALGTLEAQQSLMQVKSSSIVIPTTTLPNNARPTYLDIQLELIAPITK